MIYAYASEQIHIIQLMQTQHPLLRRCCIVVIRRRLIVTSHSLEGWWLGRVALWRWGLQRRLNCKPKLRGRCLSGVFPLRWLVGKALGCWLRWGLHWIRYRLGAMLRRCSVALNSRLVWISSISCSSSCSRRSQCWCSHYCSSSSSSA